MRPTIPCDAFVITKKENLKDVMAYVDVLGTSTPTLAVSLTGKDGLAYTVVVDEDGCMNILDQITNILIRADDLAATTCDCFGCTPACCDGDCMGCPAVGCECGCDDCLSEAESACRVCGLPEGDCIEDVCGCDCRTYFPSDEY